MIVLGSSNKAVGQINGHRENIQQSASAAWEADTRELLSKGGARDGSGREGLGD